VVETEDVSEGDPLSDDALFPSDRPDKLVAGTKLSRFDLERVIRGSCSCTCDGDIWPGGSLTPKWVGGGIAVGTGSKTGASREGGRGRAVSVVDW